MAVRADRRDELVRTALADVVPEPFWLDRPDRPPARPSLDGDTSADLVIVGAGYTGLWTALRAKDRDPSRDVLVIDADRVGGAASGRNGGFCSASLTHGEENGRTRWPDEEAVLLRLGRENLAGLQDDVSRHGIDARLEATGELTVATEAHQVSWLAPGPAGADEVDDVVHLDRDAVRAEVASPTYLAGRWDRRGTVLVDPARLAWGLADACERAGVRIVEGTEVLGLGRSPLAVTTRRGTVSAGSVVLGTNAFRSPLKRLRLHTVAVYDYALMTEPLGVEQQRAVGWHNRQGIGDSGNRFHYYRRTDDDRILWGGFDAIHHFGGRVEPRHDQRPVTSAVLADHFFTTFPQLEGLRFTHAWGGAIDTCTRFCAFFGTARRGRVAYALGYTGLGVGATRFAADVVLDLLAGEDTERTRLQMVRRRPLPFPPEPLATIGIQATRWSLARADERQGRRNLWLRLLDRAGLGFDS